MYQPPPAPSPSPWKLVFAIAGGVSLGLFAWCAGCGLLFGQAYKETEADIEKQKLAPHKRIPADVFSRMDPKGKEVEREMSDLGWVPGPTFEGSGTRNDMSFVPRLSVQVVMLRLEKEDPLVFQWATGEVVEDPKEAVGPMAIFSVACERQVPCYLKLETPGKWTMRVFEGTERTLRNLRP